MIVQIQNQINRDFWHDEAFQYLLSLKSLDFILNSPDVHPPLFNIITKILLLITNDIIILRGIIIFISFLFLAQLYKLITELYGEKTALIGLILASFMPVLVYYSVEFRSYIFVLFVVTYQTRQFFKIEKTEYSWLYYLIASWVMVYSHYLTALIILPIIGSSYK